MMFIAPCSYLPNLKRFGKSLLKILRASSYWTGGCGNGNTLRWSTWVTNCRSYCSWTVRINSIGRRYSYLQYGWLLKPIWNCWSPTKIYILNSSPWNHKKNSSWECAAKWFNSCFSYLVRPDLVCHLYDRIDFLLVPRHPIHRCHVCSALCISPWTALKYSILCCHCRFCCSSDSNPICMSWKVQEIRSLFPNIRTFT